MKERKQKEGKQKEKKQKEDNKKKNKSNKFIEIRKRWLIDGTKTIILVLILITAFIGINIFMQKLELTPIDLSQEKLYTLTEESKEKVKRVEKDVNIYFIGYSDDDTRIRP